MFIKIMEAIKNNYTLVEKDCQEFKNLNVAGMIFTNYAYYAQELGNVAIMKIHNAEGTMHMDTIIINPFEVDAPMLSYDCISMFGTNILYLEPFNTTLSNTFNTAPLKEIDNKYKDMIEENPQQERWYDDMRLEGTIFKKSTNIEALTKMVEEYYTAYFKAVKETTMCDIKAKKEKASVYSNGLIEKGGPATDPFLQAFGKEKTAQFFREVLFGV